MKKYTRKPMVAAALITLAVLLAGCTAAAALLGLKDLKVGEMIVDQEKQKFAILSLQGFKDSPSVKAAEELRQFRNSFDPDASISISGNYHHFKAPDEYDAYHCTSQEELDKVQELCKKYNLKPHGKTFVVHDVAELFKAIDLPGILAEKTEAECGDLNSQCYADGSFSLWGSIRFPGQELGDMMTFGCTRKDAFDTNTDVVVDLESYTEWHYVTSSGIDLLLAVSQEETLIFADREDFFFSVRLIANESYPTDLEERKALVEQRAECFDFSIRPQNGDTAILEAATKDYEDMLAEQEYWFIEGFRHPDYKTYLAENSYMIDSDRTYALADLTGDGIEELIFKMNDGNILNILTYDGKETSLLMDDSRLIPYMHLTDQGLWLAEGNIIVGHEACGDCQRYSFFRLEKGAYNLFDFIEYHSETNQWSRSQDGDAVSEEPLTEADAKQILESYQPMDLTFKPVTEFPMD